jgi:predicted nucleic acid-binding protein
VRTVFVDTGAWIALAVRRDQLHSSAAAHARRLARALTPLLTTNYVMLETYTYIRYHYDHHKALAFDTIIQNLIQAGRLTMVWVNEEVHGRALDIFRTYDDQVFSVADCTSFVVARDRKIQRSLWLRQKFSHHGFCSQAWQIKTK